MRFTLLKNPLIPLVMFPNPSLTFASALLLFSTACVVSCTASVTLCCASACSLTSKACLFAAVSAILSERIRLLTSCCACCASTGSALAFRMASIFALLSAISFAVGKTAFDVAPFVTEAPTLLPIFLKNPMLFVSLAVSFKAVLKSRRSLYGFVIASDNKERREIRVSIP